MSLTSLQFFAAFAVSVGIYYVIQKRFQWYALLLYSMAFFFMSSAWYTVIYLAVSILASWGFGIAVGRAKAADRQRAAGVLLACGIGINLVILAALKYTNFLIENVNLFRGLLHKPMSLQSVQWTSPIGLSFYTLQLAAYLLDIYWGITPPQENLLKTALFAGYYPQLTSGPIARHEQVRHQLYAEHAFDWKRVTFGFQRILWGIFKKLVISARAGVLVDTVYGDTVRYDGCYIWFAAFAFMLQLYADFSGCMDIVLGASECYGIVLPENFRTPFFSKSVQEFWQRWHITLGVWLKDYILYPILKSKSWSVLTKWIRARLGKKAAKQLPSYMGMLCVWILIGLWHGGSWKYILGMGFWFWLCIAAGQMLQPVFRRVISFFKINTDTFGFRLFQSLRVFVLVAFGNMFFRLDSLRTALKTIIAGFSHWNPEIFYNKELYGLGLDEQDFRVLTVSVIVLFIVSCMQEKGSVREWIAKQNLVLRWGIYFALIFAVIIYGQYGPGFDAQAFIYQGF